MHGSTSPFLLHGWGFPRFEVTQYLHFILNEETSLESSLWSALYSQRARTANEQPQHGRVFMGIHSYTYQMQLLLLHSATPARQSERQMPPSPTCSLCCLWISPTNSAFPENTAWIIHCRHLRVARWGHTTWICSITKTNSSSPSSWLREACPHSAASALLNAEH